VGSLPASQRYSGGWILKIVNPWHETLVPSNLSTSLLVATVIGVKREHCAIVALLSLESCEK
jgi:hypothetical protein